MKQLLSAALLLISSNLICAQNNIGHHIELGIDLTTPLIWASGGDRPYNEVEFIYREAQSDKDLRFKLNINNGNFYGNSLVEVRQIEDNKPESLKYVQTDFVPSTSYIASIGIAKYLKENQLPIYYGVDGNVGVGRAETWTNLRTIMLGEESERPLYKHKNHLILLGATPFLGVKKELTERIVFGIEFGISLNTILGKVEYYTENGEMNTAQVNRLDMSLNRLINDIVLLIRI